jgi:hypothetical protein
MVQQTARGRVGGFETERFGSRSAQRRQLSWSRDFGGSPCGFGVQNLLHEALLLYVQPQFLTIFFLERFLTHLTV